MTDETPSAFEVALAEAIIVASGGVCVSQYLADALADANARRHAGLAVTDAELAWIEKLAYRITGLQSVGCEATS